jgi:hypothetical protein
VRGQGRDFLVHDSHVFDGVADRRVNKAPLETEPRLTDAYADDEDGLFGFSA